MQESKESSVRSRPAMFESPHFFGNQEQPVINQEEVSVALSSLPSPSPKREVKAEVFLENFSNSSDTERDVPKERSSGSNYDSYGSEEQDSVDADLEDREGVFKEINQQDTYGYLITTEDEAGFDGRNHGKH